MADEAVDPSRLDAAYQALDSAIQDVLGAEGWEGVLGDWIVCFVTQRLNEAGESLTTDGHLVSPANSVAHYRLLGLVDYTHEVLRRQIFDGDDTGGS